MIENQMKELPSIKDENIGNFIFTIRGHPVSGNRICLKDAIFRCIYYINIIIQ